MPALSSCFTSTHRHIFAYRDAASLRRVPGRCVSNVAICVAAISVLMLRDYTQSYCIVILSMP